MPKQKLIALRQQTYATRQLKAGDPFEAKPRDARALKKLGKARDDYDAPVTEALAAPPVVSAYVPAQSPPSPEPAPTAPPVDPLDALRADAESVGVHVDRRWGEARLMQEIDDAREKAAEDAPAPESSETETPAAEPHEAVAMTTGSASALMPNPWKHDEE